jgi:hypothetical protein
MLHFRDKPLIKGTTKHRKSIPRQNSMPASLIQDVRVFRDSNNYGSPARKPEPMFEAPTKMQSNVPNTEQTNFNRTLDFHHPDCCAGYTESIAGNRGFSIFFLVI